MDNLDYKENKAKPFVKWAGGKTQLLNEIRPYYSFSKEINKYCEPFVGAGAVLFDILNNYQLSEVYISDINTELINTYNVIKNDPDELCRLLQEIENSYLTSSAGDRKTIYYENRKQFNKLKYSSNYPVLKAALFIFLNKTGFNGLYRENSKGIYNVPIGSYKKPKILDKANIEIVSNKLKNVEIHNAPYYECINFVDSNTFVYLDPPYRPLSTSSSFTSYNKNNFNDEDQVSLSSLFKKLDDKGADLLLSNSDPKNTDVDDNFFDDLYENFYIKRIKAGRSINSKKNSRGQVNELLISNIEVNYDERFQQLVFNI